MRHFTYLLSVILLLILFSCRTGSESAGDPQAHDYSATESVDNETGSPAPSPGSDEYRKVENRADTAGSPGVPLPGKDGVDIEKKLIKEGTLEYRADNLALARKQLLQAVARWKGYASSEEEYGEEGKISTTIIIRVPSVYFDSMLVAATAGITRFDRKDIHVKDVTAEFVDIQARLKTKKDLENRYLELLRKANTVSEMLEIEREIGSLRSEIESIEGQLNVMQNQVAYSTLMVTLYEVIPESGFFAGRMGDALAGGWNNLLDFFVFIVNLWPFVLLGTLGFWAMKRWRARKKVNRPHN